MSPAVDLGTESQDHCCLCWEHGELWDGRASCGRAGEEHSWRWRWELLCTTQGRGHTAQRAGVMAARCAKVVTSFPVLYSAAELHAFALRAFGGLERRGCVLIHVQKGVFSRALGSGDPAEVPCLHSWCFGGVSAPHSHWQPPPPPPQISQRSFWRILVPCGLL